ncbi:uncharacterized protein EDB91DRAFT_256232 [Suillus paluster]|uniref:uncharacterized protein n=1 Tax=Suillus paluster TaxID=48578 RepID=UPI001B865636|nr:uncharacterized protein EDB91DRAFT_256232 [Suillus paluster]KAG1754846.1 hypothetical protein EDB91DRAFT_256232 [Suillus paluster]
MAFLRFSHPYTRRPMSHFPRVGRAVLRRYRAQMLNGVRDAQNTSRLDATSNFRPPSFRGEDFMWHDVEVQNDWAMAAREPEWACQLPVERPPYDEQRPPERKEHKRVSFDTERVCRPSVDRERERRASVDRERARHVSFDIQPKHRGSVDCERGCRVSPDRQREPRASVDREREHRVSMDRKQDLRFSVDRERCCCMSIGQHYTREPVSRSFPRPPVSAVSFKPPTTGPRVSLDRQREHRASIDRRPDLRVPADREHCRCIPTGQHYAHESVYRTFPRPPVSAVSFKPPTTSPRVSPDRRQERRASVNRKQERCASIDRTHDLRVSVDRKHRRCISIGQHYTLESVSRMFPRPPVSAVSFKPPTTGPRSRHFRRPSFDYATVRDYSHDPVHVLPPPAPAPRIHFPPRQRDRTSMEAVRRLPFPTTEDPRFEKSTKPLGLARFNPFKRLRTTSMSNSQKKRPMLEPSTVHSNRLRRKTAGRA